MSTTALDIRQAADLKPWTPAFVMSVDEAVHQVEMKRAFMKRVMVEDAHYGTIPGTPKPSLWKPGAELLLSSMGLHAELTDAAPPILDVTGRDHGGEAFVEYRRACTIYRQIGPAEHDRMVVARAEGSCNSWETKYRWRSAKPQCPDCRQESVKNRRDGGAWCDRNSGGCGHSFQPGDERISGQQLGRVKNPDVADVLNTLLKMADKRAFVASTLLATGCSDIFTQDMADEDDEPREARGEAPAGTSRAGRPNGNGGNGGRTNLGGGASDEHLAELLALNKRLGDKGWSPPMVKGRATRPNGYATTKAELEELLSKAGPAASRPYNAETGEVEPEAPPADPEEGQAR